MDQNCGIWASSGMKSAKPGACEKASRTGSSPTARRMPDITARSLKQSVKNYARFGLSYLWTIPANLLGEHLYLSEAESASAHENNAADAVPRGRHRHYLLAQAINTLLKSEGLDVLHKEC